jgi:DNA-binding transcriptional LysR family regulator
LAEFRLGKAAETRPLRLGSAESVVRWLLAPRFPEVLSAAGSVVESENHRTSAIVEKLENGSLDVGIIRAGAGDDRLVRLPFTTIKFLLMVPRSRLPDKSPEGIAQAGVLPFILLTGDGTFVRSVERVATENSLTLQLYARVDGFGPAIELAKTLDAATFIPAQAQGEFQLDRFTPVPLVGLDQMDRDLVVAYNRDTAELNPRAQRFATRLSRAFETARRS